MTIRTSMTLLVAPAILATLLSACDGGPSSPSASTPPAAPRPAPVTYTLFGAVSEMTPAGTAPVARAQVGTGGRTATTDADGLYSIDGLSAATRAVVVSKAGYATAVATVAMSGDTQVDIRLDRIPSGPSYTLAGVVFEITEGTRNPIAGVEIYCDSCGSPDGHTFVFTDADGFYSLSWAANGTHPLFVTKPGYGVFDPTLLDGFGRTKATVNGDTRFDIQLVRQ